MKIKFQREKGERFIFEKLVSEKLTGTDRSTVNILVGPFLIYESLQMATMIFDLKKCWSG